MTNSARDHYPFCGFFDDPEFRIPGNDDGGPDTSTFEGREEGVVEAEALGVLFLFRL